MITKKKWFNKTKTRLSIDLSLAVGYISYTIKHEAYLTYILCNFGGVVKNVLYAISEF